MRRLLAATLGIYVVTLIVLLHANFGGRDVWLLGVTCGLFVAAVWALARARLRPRTVALVVLGAGALLQFVALARAPLTSDDANRYVWDAKVQLSGIDPYRYPPQAPQLAQLRDPALFGPASGCTYRIPGGCTAINRPAVRTIYPPVAQAGFDLGRVVSFGGHGGVFVYQVLAALGALAVAWLLIRRFAARGSPVWPAALWAWCPVVVLEFGNNGHLDWLAVLLSVLALDAGARGRDGWAGVLAGAAVATKLYPALVLPALMRRRPWLVAFAGVATIVLVYVPHVMAVGRDVIGYLPGYLHEQGYNSGSGLILLGAVLPHSVATVAGVIVLAVAAWWTWRHSDPLAPEQMATVLTGIAFLVVTPSYGWYASLLIALAVLSARYEWIVFAAAPSYTYLIHERPAGPIAYSICALAMLVCWRWRTRAQLSATDRSGLSGVRAERLRPTARQR